jgi:hypothetical protein
MTKYIYHEEAPCTVLLKMAKLPPTFNTTPSFRPINPVQCPCQGLHYFRRRRENTTSISKSVLLSNINTNTSTWHVPTFKAGAFQVSKRAPVKRECLCQI